MNNTRTDEHRPSAIIPEDYTFVAFEVVRGAFQGDLGACEYMLQQREIIREHMARTGGTYSSHAHGGNCMVCGNANAIYTILYYHAKSNSYVRMGEDCAYKVDCSYGDMNAFRRAVKDALQAVAGKRKAEAFLVAENLERAWDIYVKGSEFVTDPQTGRRLTDAAIEYRRTWKFEEATIADIVGKLVQYGSISEKQTAFVRSLVNRMPEREKIQRQREAEKAAAADCPKGRVTVYGVILKTDTRETAYGLTEKMLVKDTMGFVVWSTIPAKAVVQKGDSIKFTATLEPSKDDPKFGFASRPSLVAVFPKEAAAS